MMKKLKVDYASMNLIADAIEHQAATILQDGDKVRIDVDAIMDRPDFEKMQLEYQEFIKSAGDREFTVVKEEKYIGKPLASLAEDPREVKWLFWEGNLIKIDKTEEEN